MTENKIYTATNGFRKFMASASGVIIGVVGIFTAFFASLMVTEADGNITAVDKLSSLSFWMIWSVVFIVLSGVGNELPRHEKRKKTMKVLKWHWGSILPIKKYGNRTRGVFATICTV